MNKSGYNSVMKIPVSPLNLVLLLLVELHGDQAAGREAAVRDVAAVRRLAAVRFQVFVQIRQAFTPCRTQKSMQ